MTAEGTVGTPICFLEIDIQQLPTKLNLSIVEGGITTVLFHAGQKKIL
jgi:hypothetical protein